MAIKECMYCNDCKNDSHADCSICTDNPLNWDNEGFIPVGRSYTPNKR